MQNFRRFKFQPTRAESELSLLEPAFQVHRLRERTIQRHEVTSASEIDSQYRHMLKRLTQMDLSGYNSRQPNILNALNNLGALMMRYGKYAESEKIYLCLLEETGKPKGRPRDSIMGAEQPCSGAVVSR